MDYVLLTHPDADHIQGYGFIRKAFPIGRLFFHDFPYQEFGTSRQQLQQGDRFSIAGVDHLVLHPPGHNPLGSHWNTNNNSLVVQLQYRDFKILFTGDIEKDAEQYLVSKLSPVTILKAAHHGSRTSNTWPLLEKTQPRLAIISAGRKNLFGHPSKDTLRRFSEANVPVLATSQWGSLRIETDGIQWQVFHYSRKEKTFQKIRLIGTEDWMLPDHSKPGTRVTRSMFCPQRGEVSSKVNSLYQSQTVSRLLQVQMLNT